MFRVPLVNGINILMEIIFVFYNIYLITWNGCLPPTYRINVESVRMEFERANVSQLKPENRNHRMRKNLPQRIEWPTGRINKFNDSDGLEATELRVICNNKLNSPESCIPGSVYISSLPSLSTNKPGFYTTPEVCFSVGKRTGPARNGRSFISRLFSRFKMKENFFLLPGV